MKLTVLCENNARVGAYYLAEPGVSYYIECDGKKILFDTGFSDVFLRNAQALGIDLTALDAIALSHGHDDHTGGLPYLPATENKIPLYACSGIFDPKREEGKVDGSPLTLSQAQERFALHLSAEPAAITEHLWHLGEIPRVTDFECRRPFGEKFVDGKWEEDYMLDDSALVYVGKEGLTIITGCSHCGICNIVEQAKKVFHEERIAGVIGGLHMPKMTPKVGRTVEYLKAQNVKRLCPCHCTGFYARAAIHAAAPIEEICVADTPEFT